jgi:hypothetical protein
VLPSWLPFYNPTILYLSIPVRNKRSLLFSFLFSISSSVLSSSCDFLWILLEVSSFHGTSCVLLLPTPLLYHHNVSSDDPYCPVISKIGISLRGALDHFTSPTKPLKQHQDLTHLPSPIARLLHVGRGEFSYSAMCLQCLVKLKGQKNSDLLGNKTLDEGKILENLKSLGEW